ncbi:hypothetical protein [Gorillibacterium sp. CAU 1737]|uniref:hypothetical protein n=1 Tax=Gorillibacterium sp. CAU 1737 TaxID=3140362 RepID=UPI00326027D6
MNLVDAYVTQVLAEPEYIDKYAGEGLTWWQVKVLYNSYGRTSETTLSFPTREEAAAVTPGHHFLT